MSDIIEQVKQANRIEEVIEETGSPLGGSGRYRRGVENDSLVVDVEKQAYWWNSRGEAGDVIHWVMRRLGLDFKAAVAWLARRAGMEEPDWGDAARGIIRRRMDVLTAAAALFHAWLLRDERALAYARGRGWTDETIGRALLGYSGSGTRAQRDALRAELRRVGVEDDEPVAVALLGYQGDVAGWAQAHDITPRPRWLERGRVPGIVGMRLLLYPHWWNGGVRYLSGRSIGEKKFHYNLPAELAGARLPYYNALYSANSDEVIIVEGQADAVTLLQWGWAAVALAGLELDDTTVAALRRRHAVLYVGLDRDPAGERKAVAIARRLGPLTRLVRWGGDSDTDNEHAKDANDWLKAWIKVGIPHEEQVMRVRQWLDTAEPLLLHYARLAGEIQGARSIALQDEVIAMLASLPPLERARYRRPVAKYMGLGLRELDGLVRAMSQQANQKEVAAKDEGGEATPLIGGYIDGYLIELLYDPKQRKTLFAVRDPSGNVQVAESIRINGTLYHPIAPTPEITKGVVRLPSELPSEPPDIRELIQEIRAFIHRYLDIDPFYERLASFYVLFTWMYDAFRVVPYLRALGDYGTGKSRFIETIGNLCYRPIFTFGATTLSPIFRLLDKYRGTLVLDEADFQKSDESAYIIKLLNAGNRAGGILMRTKDLGRGQGYVVDVFSIYGPKIIATRRKFADRALESRCLTKEMGGSTVRPDIPVVLPERFDVEAQQLRNKLLAYRMFYWQPSQDVDYNAVDHSIEPRLNQVTLALKTLVDDETLRREIDEFIREYNKQLVVERSMTLTAKVLEALVRIRSQVAYSLDEEGRPIWDFTLKNVARVTNEIIDEENEDDVDEDEDETPKRRRKRVSPKKVGFIARNYLQLATERLSSGPLRGRYAIIWDEQRILALCKRYGVEPEWLLKEGSSDEHDAPDTPTWAQDEIPF